MRRRYQPIIAAALVVVLLMLIDLLTTNRAASLTSATPSGAPTPLTVEVAVTPLAPAVSSVDTSPASASKHFETPLLTTTRNITAAFVGTPLRTVVPPQTTNSLSFSALTTTSPSRTVQPSVDLPLSSSPCPTSVLRTLSQLPKTDVEVCGASPHQKRLNGSFSQTQAPFFFPTTGCSMWNRSAEEAVACLFSRRIFILGNSVARAYAFELPVLLESGQRADRDGQKRECGKTRPRGVQAGHAQSCALQIGSSVTVSFLWRQLLGEVPESFASATASEGEFCYEQAARQCHSDFWNSSQPGDILVVTQGLLYARYPKATLDSEFTGSAVAPDMPPDLEAALVRDAKVLIDNVRDSFHGSHIIVVTTPKMVRRAYEGVFVDEWPPGTNARAHVINERLRKLWNEVGWPVIEQRIVNEIAVASATAEKVYEDHVHFPGVLSQMMWYNLMSLVEAREGVGGRCTRGK